MPVVESLGFEPTDVAATLSFLLDRAEAHEAQALQEATLHRLCAATLKRDAAALAIILGDYPKAHYLLREAGEEYAAEDTFYGLTLLSVADQSPSRERFQDRLADLASPESEQDTAGYMSPADRRRVSSVFERVSALQALSLAGKRKQQEERARSNLSREFQKFPMEVGPAETRTPLYFRMLDMVSSSGDAAPELYEARDLHVLSAIREAELRSARADEYHWQFLLNPSDIVGFDIMFLTLAAIRHGQPVEPFYEAFGAPGSATGLPIEAAVRLSDT